MSDVAETGHALETARHREIAGIPNEAREEIETVVSTFRRWLIEAERWRDGCAERTTDDIAFDNEVDLHTLVEEFIAVKTELNLAARGSKVSRERLDQVGGDIQRLLDPLVRDRDQWRDKGQARIDAAERRWIDVLLDVRDALGRCLAALQSNRRDLGWRRLFLPRDLLPGLSTGYGSSLRRIDAALEGCGIRRMACVGRPVDPERMRVVDVVPHRTLAPGMVIDVIRDGYVRADRVIRHAEVRAVSHDARSATDVTTESRGVEIAESEPKIEILQSEDDVSQGG